MGIEWLTLNTSKARRMSSTAPGDSASKAFEDVRTAAFARCPSCVALLPALALSRRPRPQIFLGDRPLKRVPDGPS